MRRGRGLDSTPIQVRLYRGDVERLDAVAAARGVPPSEIIRELVHLGLEAQETGLTRATLDAVAAAVQAGFDAAVTASRKRAGRPTVGDPGPDTHDSVETPTAPNEEDERVLSALIFCQKVVSQAEVSRRLQTPQSSVSRWTGRHRPIPEHVRDAVYQLADALRNEELPLAL